jgi:BSD domain
MLDTDTKLGKLRNQLVPISITEEEFWVNYFFAIEEIMEEFLVVFDNDDKSSEELEVDQSAQPEVE